MILRAVAVLVLLTGCATVTQTPEPTAAEIRVITGVGADGVSVTEPLRQVVPREPVRPTRIAVTVTHYGLDEVTLGIEGAVFFLRATTFEGELVLDRIINPISDLVFLASSDYAVTAYYRPCAGNCLRLDFPQEICSLPDVSIGDNGRFAMEINVRDGACSIQPQG